MRRKTALITGATGGIGREMAIQFAMSGYDLFLCCHKEEEQLKKDAKFLTETYHVDCGIFAGDLSDPDMCKSLFEQVDALDVLINNAAISYVGLLSELSPAQWEKIVGVNLSAPLYCSQLAIPMFLSKKEGCIINISSVWGEVGASMEVAYSATKGGLNAFTRALAKELAPSGIRVNAISCGLIDTKMNAHLSPEEMQDVIDDIPANRAGEPADVAKLALQLAESGTYLTGQVIRLDGAWI